MGDGNKGFPWMPLYTEWLSDPYAQSLSLAQQGMFVKLLLIQWREGKIPDDAVCLKMLAVPVELEEEYRTLVQRSFNERSNPRLAKISAEQRQKMDLLQRAGRVAGLASGKKRRALRDSRDGTSNGRSTVVEPSLNDKEQTKILRGDTPLPPPTPPPPLELISEEIKGKRKGASKNKPPKKKKPHPTVGKLEWDIKKLEFGKGRQELREAINDRYLRSHGEEWITTVYRGMREKLTWQPEMIQEKESQWMFVLNWYQRAAQNKADQEARWQQKK